MFRPPVPDPAPAPPLLREPAFRALWISRVVSFTGDGIGRIAIVLLALRDGPTAVSLVLLAYTVPRLLGPLAGTLADRYDRRRLMRGCEWGGAAIMTAIAVTLPALPVLIVLVAATSALATVFGPTSSSTVPMLVSAPQLPRANAMIATAFNFQIALGPAIGGVAVGLSGARLAFALDAATFAVSALVLGALPVVAPDAESTAARRTGRAGGIWRETAEGLRYVRRTPGVRALVVALVVFVAFAGIDNVALPFLVEGSLHGSAEQFGLVQAAFGVGMLAASGYLSVARRAASAAVLLIGGAVLGMIGALATAVAPTVLAVAATQALAGIGNGADNIATNTHVQHVAPAPVLGRVFGTIGTAAQAGSGLAYVGAGPLVAALGARWAFVVAGAGSVIGIVLLVPALRARPAAPG